MRKALLLSIAAIVLALPALSTRNPKQPAKTDAVFQPDERSVRQWETANAHMRTVSELEVVITSNESMLEQGVRTPGLAQDTVRAQELKNRILSRVADSRETGVYSDLSKWQYTPDTKNIAGGYAWTGPAPQPLVAAIRTR